MTPSRLSVLNALATLFGGTEVNGAWPNMHPTLVGAGYRLFGLRLRTFANVDAADKPALFLVSYGEGHTRTGISATDNRTLNFMAVIMQDVSDPAIIPSQAIQPLLDAIDDVLFQARHPLTGIVDLGGLVNQVWVDGAAKISPGDLDGQTVATYPIQVLCP